METSTSTDDLSVYTAEELRTEAKNSSWWRDIASTILGASQPLLCGLAGSSFLTADVAETVLRAITAVGLFLTSFLSWWIVKKTRRIRAITKHLDVNRYRHHERAPDAATMGGTVFQDEPGRSS